jgi:predicted heme/steroid binding protein
MFLKPLHASYVNGAVAMSAMKEYTKEELAKFDGKNGTKALIAVNGKVYDVTGIDLWQDGDHMSMHSAGQDLTGVLSESPHDDSIFEKIKLVGTLKQ